MGAKNWTNNEIEIVIKLNKKGKSSKEISFLIGRSHNAVDKKLRRLGYNSLYKNPILLTKIDYNEVDWNKIQNLYDEGLSWRDLKTKHNISELILRLGKKEGKLIFRTNKDAIKLAHRNKKFKQSCAIGLLRYRQLCQFKFAIKDYPSEFEISLIEKYGWYKAKNRGDNQNGVSRDHMYSVKEGFINNINPYYISHPANCLLMQQTNNIKKKANCSINFEDLKNRIESWNNKYNTELAQLEEL